MIRPPTAQQGVWVSAAGPRFIEILGPAPEGPRDLLLIRCDGQQLAVPSSAVHAISQEVRTALAKAMSPAPNGRGW